MDGIVEEIDHTLNVAVNNELPRKYNQNLKDTGRHPNSISPYNFTPHGIDPLDGLDEFTDYGDNPCNDTDKGLTEYYGSLERGYDAVGRIDYRAATKELHDGLVDESPRKKDVEELRERGRKVLSKAKSKSKGNPIIFYMTESGYISTIKSVWRIKKHFEGKELSQHAQIILCQTICNFIVKKGYAPPLVLARVGEFTEGLTVASREYVDKQIEKTMRRGISPYFKELALDTKAPQYKRILAKDLKDGRYLNWELLDILVKLIFINAPLGTGKSVAAGIYHLMRHLGSHVLSLAARVNLTIALTNSMNKAAMDYSNGKITQKEHIDKFKMMVSQYDVEDVKGLKHDLVNDTNAPLKVVYTLDSLLKLSEGKGGLGLFNEECTDIAINRNKKPFILILDEIELLLNHLTGKTIVEKTRILQTLKMLIKKADKVIVMDAFLTQKTINFIVDIAQCDYQVYHVESSHMKDINVSFCAGNTHYGAGLDMLTSDCQALSETAKGDRVKGRIAIPCNTAGDAKAIGLKLNRLFCNNSELDSSNTLNIAVYTGGSSKELIVYRRKGKNNATESFDPNEFQDNPNKFLAEKNIDVFIYSPVMESGVSIDGAPSFTKMYAFAQPSPFSSGANGLKQASYRFRHAFDWHISIAAYTSGGNRFISMKTLEDFVDHKKVEFQNAAISIRDNGQTKATKDALVTIMRELDVAVATLFINELADGTYKFSQEFHDLARYEAIAYLSTTHFARYFYYDLLAMGILPENIHGIVTDDDDVDIDEERSEVKYTYRERIALAATPSQQRLDELHAIKKDLTLDEQSQKVKGDLLKLYAENGVYNSGKSVFDPLAADRAKFDSPRIDYIDFDSFSVEGQVELIKEWEGSREAFYSLSTSIMSEKESRNKAKLIALVSAAGLGNEKSYQADGAKIGDSIVRAAKVATCNLLFEQYQQDDGVSVAFLKERGAEGTLGFKGRNINEQAQQYLRKHMGIPSNVFESKSIRINGVKTKIVRFRQEFLDGSDWMENWIVNTPVVIHAMNIAALEKDGNSLFIQKIADSISKN
ncbi:MAG: hypothetical protein VSS52_002310 [Thiotrichaceae bacterium]|nr:hypothetical protein [Thiotrichaceae bacterium]